MDILFKSAKLRKECTDARKMQQRHGPRRADIVRRRLDAMANADNLGVLRLLPQLRAHELKSDRAGQLAVDLDHPYRLIFVPDHDPTPTKEDGGLDWAKVTAVRILEIVDYHD